jgi:hypothetical protein
MIAACEQNIANYMLIEDQEERQRALDAAYGMKEQFEEIYQFELDEHIKEVTK